MLIPYIHRHRSRQSKLGTSLAFVHAPQTHTQIYNIYMYNYAIAIASADQN